MESPSGWLRRRCGCIWCRVAGCPETSGGKIGITETERGEGPCSNRTWLMGSVGLASFSGSTGSSILVALSSTTEFPFRFPCPAPKAIFSPSTLCSVLCARQSRGVGLASLDWASLEPPPADRRPANWEQPVSTSMQVGSELQMDVHDDGAHSTWLALNSDFWAGYGACTEYSQWYG